MNRFEHIYGDGAGRRSQVNKCEQVHGDPLNRQTDRHDWEYYFPTKLLVDSNDHGSVIRYTASIIDPVVHYPKTIIFFQFFWVPFPTSLFLRLGYSPRVPPVCCSHCAAHQPNHPRVRRHVPFNPSVNLTQCHVRLTNLPKKVFFFNTSVCQEFCPQRGGVHPPPAGRHTEPPPPPGRYPQGRHTLGRHSPGRHPPLGKHPLAGRHTQPPWQADTPSHPPLAGRQTSYCNAFLFNLWN